jgi:hypothetical protein
VTQDEIETLRRWIKQGAAYKKHWSFTAPKMPVIPPGSANAVDALVQTRLAKDGLELNAEADRAPLLRRLSFDLTGLPPNLAELDAFLSDTSAQAYEKQVDRLLAAPSFGERMAQDWLDVARFADTFGYQSDVTMLNWPYRDWVINSFNENLPFSDFITQQLAGDLLPSPTRDQLVATTFNRLHRQTNEGGSVNEEYRIEYINDRVQTFGLAFLGLTLECCKCHDHKYDPISAKDFYSLGSFFSNIDESGLYSHFTNATPTPALPLTTSAQDASITELTQKILAQQHKLHALETAAVPPLATWAKDLAVARPIANLTFDTLLNGKFADLSHPETPATTTDVVTIAPGKVGQAVQLTGENNVTMAAGGKFTRTDAFSFSFWMKTPDVKERAVIFHRSKAWTDAASCGYELLLENGKLSAALIHFWPGNALRVNTRDPIPVDEWTHVVWSYDGSSTAAGLHLYVNGHRAEVEVIRDGLTKDINRGGEDLLAIGQRFRDKGFKGGLVDEFAVYEVALTSYEARCLAANDTLPILDTEVAEYYFNRVDSASIKERSVLAEQRKQAAGTMDSISDLMIMRELPQPKAAYILKRGSYDAPGERVWADVPNTIFPFDKSLPHDRLGLARWLTDAGHPLTARVIVNRFWQALWGVGLVSTAEDFGLQGQLPTHPELLDYLACRFRDGGWNVKALVKEIVLSKTYRQDSKVSAEKRSQDPENKLLSRGPAVRLSAEAVRDQVLYVSGALQTVIGGNSVDPDKTSRRSLYTFWKRTMPDVRMELFDMAKREVCIARRQTTNTPLQALTLLNEPRFLQATAALAQQALTQHADLQERLIFLFRTLTSQAPNQKEISILTQLFQEQRNAFNASRSSASFLKATSAGEQTDEATASELAATIQVTSAIMNFDSFIIKR